MLIFAADYVQEHGGQMAEPWCWSRRRESNPLPVTYKATALPVELRRLVVLSEGWSGWWDSNPRLPAPKAGVQPLHHTQTFWRSLFRYGLLVNWCQERGSNPQVPFGTPDFESGAFTRFRHPGLVPGEGVEPTRHEDTCF